MYCLNGNIVNFSHESSTFLFCWRTTKIHSNQRSRKIPKTSHSPWGMWTPPNIPIPGPTPLTSQTAAPTFHALLHKYAKKSGWLQWDALYLPRNCPFPWGNRQSQILASSLDPLTHHPKWHPYPVNSFATMDTTDRPTDGPRDKTTYAQLIIQSDVANKDYYNDKYNWKKSV